MRGSLWTEHQPYGLALQFELLPLGFVVVPHLVWLLLHVEVGQHADVGLQRVLLDLYVVELLAVAVVAQHADELLPVEHADLLDVEPLHGVAALAVELVGAWASA